MSKRSLVFSMALAMGFSVLVASGSALAQRIPPKDTLRFAGFSVKVLDPHFGGGGSTEFFQYKVYDSLFAFDENMVVQPQMAEKFTWNADKTMLTVTLRPGLKFHDGQPVRAADAVASLKRWSNGRRGTARIFKKFTKSIDVVDDKTLTWTLTEPFGMSMEVITSVRYPPAIIPERLAKTPRNKQIKDFTGSGPYIFLPDEYVPGKQLHFKKFEDYVPRSEPPSFTAGGKKVHVKKLEWKIMKDDATRVAALRTGEIDLIQEVPHALRKDLLTDPNVVLKPLRTGRQGLIFINHLAPPFDNKKARQALLWLISQEETLTAITGDPALYQTCPSVWTCASPYATDVASEAIMKQDLEKAKQLMKEGGYNGQTIQVFQAGSTATFSNATVLAANLRKIGVKVQHQAMNRGAAIARRKNTVDPNRDPKKGWHIYVQATQEVTPSIPALMGLLQGDGCNKKGFYGWTCDERIGKLKVAFGQAKSEAERKKIAAELQKVVYDTVPYIQTGLYSNEAAYRSNVKGAVRAPSPIYWNIRKE